MEVCVDCVESAANAVAGGASRLELCSALSEGGLTPSVGVMRVVKRIVDVPVFVMVRPRRGTDFAYSEDEVEAMEVDIKELKRAGADGFVFGALGVDGRRVDARACARLVRAAGPLPCTFHRAFDMLRDPRSELEAVIGLGFARILTSGAKESALLGVGLIKELVTLAGDRIKIVAGAGVTVSNLETILRETGVREFHASARKRVEKGPKGEGGVAMGTEGGVAEKGGGKGGVAMGSEGGVVEKGGGKGGVAMGSERGVAEKDGGKGGVAMGSSDTDSCLMIADQELVRCMVNISKQVWSL